MGSREGGAEKGLGGIGETRGVGGIGFGGVGGRGGWGGAIGAGGVSGGCVITPGRFAGGRTVRSACCRGVSAPFISMCGSSWSSSNLFGSSPARGGNTLFGGKGALFEMGGRPDDCVERTGTAPCIAFGGAGILFSRWK